MSVFPVNEPFKFEGELKENAIQGVINAMKSQTDTRDLTPRDIGEMLALGGMGPRPIGTPDMVADELMKWIEEGDLDGFNLSAVVNPESWQDVVELLVPELQKRGVYWPEYPKPGGTLRENPSSKPGHPHLADNHPGSKFKWNAPKNVDNLPTETIDAAVLKGEKEFVVLSSRPDGVEVEIEAPADKLQAEPVPVEAS